MIEFCCWKQWWLKQWKLTCSLLLEISVSLKKEIGCFVKKWLCSFSFKNDIYFFLFPVFFFPMEYKLLTCFEIFVGQQKRELKLVVCVSSIFPWGCNSLNATLAHGKELGIWSSQGEKSLNCPACTGNSWTVPSHGRAAEHSGEQERLHSS